MPPARPESLAGLTGELSDLKGPRCPGDGGFLYPGMILKLAPGSGAGATALVADKLGGNAIGIELNSD